MTPAYFVLKLVHVLAASLWLGGPPVAVFRVERTLELGPAPAHAEIQRLLAVTPLFIGAALTTLLTGALLIWTAGGLAQAPRRILLGAVLTVPIFAVGGAMNRPALLGLASHFGAGRDAAGARPLIARFLWAHRIEQFFRVCVLALMVLPLDI